VKLHDRGPSASARPRVSAVHHVHRINRAVNEHLGRAQDRLADPLLTALTTLLLVLMFVVSPLHAAGIIHGEIVGFGIVLAVISCVLVVTASLFAAVLMLIAVGLAVAATYYRLQERSSLDILLDASAVGTIGLVLIWAVSRAVFGPGQVTYHKVIGAVLLYLTIGFTFVAAYTFVGLANPGAFAGLAIAESPAIASDLIYFSFVTMTTVGYGDVAPVDPLARSLSNVEAIIGQLYPATLLARLVTLELEHRRGNSAR
jgi:hypothetical protein